VNARRKGSVFASSLHRVKAHCIKFCKANIQGQQRNTCTASLSQRLAYRISVAVAKYHRVRNALFALHGPGPWEEVLQVLRDEDLRALAEFKFDVDDGGSDGTAAGRKSKRKCTAALSEGRQLILWIWVAGTGVVVDSTDSGLTEGVIDQINVVFYLHTLFAALHVKWAKA
jgi:hypothetical protein